MKYLCFGYYDKDKFDGMTESERNAMFDTCFEYDDHLRSNGHWGGGEALQGPETALTLCRTVLKSGLERIWGFMPPRPAPAMDLWATTRCICPVRR